MAEQCPKCGCPITSIRLADHVRRCTATQKLTGSSGMAVRRRRAVRITTAELESRRVAGYYQQLWKKEDEDLDDILRGQGRKPKLRNPGPYSSPKSVTAASSDNQAREKEIAAMKGRIAELEAILRNRSGT